MKVPREFRRRAGILAARRVIQLLSQVGRPAVRFTVSARRPRSYDPPRGALRRAVPAAASPDGLSLRAGVGGQLV